MNERGEGAEVCDLLVVFENHVIVFSDKDCEFPVAADPELAWRRWYKRAILKSAQQVWGAERWIRSNPTRLFLDRSCRRPFPIDITDQNELKVHRIVVAHDTTGRRRRAVGGSGTLMINPSLVGPMHTLSRADGGQPFAIGRIDGERGYVHVLDDVSLTLVLQTLDTITDFIQYLDRKERFVDSGRLFGAFGEEDLLAFYVKNTNDDGDHDFVLSPDSDKVLLEEGHWRDFVSRPERKRQLIADRESYLWDAIIEDVSSHIIGGTLSVSSGDSIADQEPPLRAMAREPRTRRRFLARFLREKVESKLPAGDMAFRVVEPSGPGDPHFVFVISSPPSSAVRDDAGYERYRMQRRDILLSYCMVVMHKYADTSHLVGIATEAGVGSGRSHDLCMIHRDVWDEELATDAKEIQQRTGWLTNMRYHKSVESEYPIDPALIAPGRVGRNSPCPCGSGVKFKRCHGSN